MTKQKKLNEKKENCFIQRLENSVYYGVETLFIYFSSNGFRLIGIKGQQVIVDSYYTTLRGAKIAFARSFMYKVFSKEIDARWSHAYPADWYWLKEKIDLCNTHRT
jgi:hypothetical protein